MWFLLRLLLRLIELHKIGRRNLFLYFFIFPLWLIDIKHQVNIRCHQDSRRPQYLGVELWIGPVVRVEDTSGTHKNTESPWSSLAVVLNWCRLLFDHGRFKHFPKPSFPYSPCPQEPFLHFAISHFANSMKLASGWNLHIKMNGFNLVAVCLELL